MSCFTGFLLYFAGADRIQSPAFVWNPSPVVRVEPAPAYRRRLACGWKGRCGCCSARWRRIDPHPTPPLLTRSFSGGAPQLSMQQPKPLLGRYPIESLIMDDAPREVMKRDVPYTQFLVTASLSH